LKKQAAPVLLKYHYLTNISRGFKSGQNYGLFLRGRIIGVIIFTGFPVPELSKGLFGLDRNEQDGLIELSRLCIEPTVQQSEHNIASWFVGRAIKKLCKEVPVRAILSYADSGYHIGTVYQACNFRYFGLSEQRSDFWIKQSDGSFLKHNRGPTKNLGGEWRPRNQKHRYLLVFDKTLKPLWKEQSYPKK